MKSEKKATPMFDNVKKVGDDVRKAGRSAWLAGLGVIAYAEEETRGLYDKLVHKGETFEKSEKNVVGRKVDEFTGKAKSVGDEIGTKVQTSFQGVMHRAGVPTSEEIHTLIQRVETLTAKVEKMQQSAH